MIAPFQTPRSSGRARPQHFAQRGENPEPADDDRRHTNTNSVSQDRSPLRRAAMPLARAETASTSSRVAPVKPTGIGNRRPVVPPNAAPSSPTRDGSRTPQATVATLSPNAHQPSLDAGRSGRFYCMISLQMPARSCSHHLAFEIRIDPSSHLIRRDGVEPEGAARARSRSVAADTCRAVSLHPNTDHRQIDLLRRGRWPRNRSAACGPYIWARLVRQCATSTPVGPDRR